MLNKINLKEIKVKELVEFMTKINNEYPFAFEACVEQAIRNSNKKNETKLKI